MYGLTAPDPCPVNTPSGSLDRVARSARHVPTTVGTTIVLAHEGNLVRGGLRMQLESVEGFTVVAEADDFDSVMRYVRGHRPDVLVVDLDLGGPARHGIQAVVQVGAQLPEVAVVIVSHEESLTEVRDAIAAGALGCVPTTATTHQFVETVRRAAAGETCVPPEILVAIANRPNDPPDGLSRREVEIIGLLAMGHTNAEIGGLLFLSVRTVESHRARFQMKIGCKTRAQLVAYAHAHGMTQAPAVIDAVSRAHRGPRTPSHKARLARKAVRPARIG